MGLGSLEGSPFIIRFKTTRAVTGFQDPTLGLEGSPFIIRFKTKNGSLNPGIMRFIGLEGSPFIIRFKTS